MRFNINIYGISLFIFSLILSLYFNDKENYIFFYTIIVLSFLSIIKEQINRKSIIILSSYLSIVPLIFFEPLNLISIFAFYFIPYSKRFDELYEKINPSRVLWNQTEDIVFIKNKNLEYYAINNSMIEYYKIVPSKFIGKNDFELYDEDTAILFRNSDIEAINNGSSTIFASVTRNNKTMHSMIIKQALIDKNGDLIGILGVSRDISELYNLKNTLEEKNKIVEQLLKYSPNPIFIKSPESIYTLVNESFAKIHEKTINDIISKDDFDLFDKVTALTHREIDVKILKDKKILINHTHNMIGNKEYYTITTKGPIEDNDGNIVGIIGIVQDITDYKNIEKKILRSQKMESIGNLAGGIAHDLNNILTGVSGYASLLQLTLKNGQSLEYVNNIIKTNKRATDLISKLLIFSAKQIDKIVSIDLNENILETYELLKPSLKKQIYFRFNLSAKFNIDGDLTQINQVILNLIINAVESIKADGIITISSCNKYITDPNKYQYHSLNARKGEYVVFSVEDTGSGIPKDILSKIFEPFFSTKNSQGTGLGLSIVYGVIIDQGGIITVVSEKNKGSKFEIMLPKGKLYNEKIELKKSDIQIGSGIIQVIDDEIPILRLLSKMLPKIGYKVLTSSDGREGINLYKNHSNDIKCVILDLLMPGLDGMEVFDMLRQINPECKVILSSGFGVRGDMSQIMSRGFIGFLAKPYTIDDISKLLSNL